MDRLCKRVLLVDDDERALDQLTRFLSRAGCDVVATTSPLEALRLAQGHHFDVAVLDLNMREMRGDELARRLLAHRPQTRVGLLSGAIDPFDTAVRGLAFVVRKGSGGTALLGAVTGD